MSEARFSRHLALEEFGQDGQQRLGRAHALIIGAGGLGCVVTQYLARSGVSTITIVDPDTVDVTNLPRQVLYTDDDIGRSKAEVAAERLRRENPGIETIGIADRLDEARMRDRCAEADVVVDCTDNLPSRFAINRACRATATPLVTGAAIRFEGQVAVFRHEEPASACYECLYSDTDEALANCEGQGILSSVAGTVGSVQSTEALRILALPGRGLADRLWVYDGGSGESRTIRITKRTDCPACGS